MLHDVVQAIVLRHYSEGNLEEMREELLRTIALDFEVDQELFHRLGEDGVVDRAYEAAVDYYNRKRSVLAQPFHDSMLRVLNSDQENKPERVYVDFTDGRQVLRAVVKVEDAVATQGQEINDAIERVSMLSFIDNHWTEHLRNLDELKEGIGLRAFGQRDPLIEYKMEAFKLFSTMMETINHDVVSFVLRAGPLVDGGQQRRRSTQRRLDPNRARSSHASADPSYGVGSGAQGGSEGRDPSVKQQPVVVSDRVGRNDPCPCGSGKKYKHCHGRS
jgi:preprotein translocase subunit SecA